MLPHVILHNAVSVDGRIDAFRADVALYYQLAAQWKEDATLGGSETMLKAFPPDPATDPLEPFAVKAGDTRPLLIVPDSRARLRYCWNAVRKAPYWRDIVVLCSHTTPRDYIEYLKRGGIHCIIVGEERVDLKKALERLYDEYGVRTIRADSGGTLNGVLLRAGLVNEVSILVHPYLVGGVTPQSIFRAEDIKSAEEVISLKLTKIEQLKDDIIWLCYNVVYR